MTKKQSFNLEIMGHQQLLAALNDLPDSMTKKAVRAGARSVAKKVKTEAERRAPKDEGHLKKSFKVRALSKKGRRYNREGRANKKFFEGTKGFQFWFSKLEEISILKSSASLFVYIL